MAPADESEPVLTWVESLVPPFWLECTVREWAGDRNATEKKINGISLPMWARGIILWYPRATSNAHKEERKKRTKSQTKTACRLAKRKRTDKTGQRVKTNSHRFLPNQMEEKRNKTLYLSFTHRRDTEGGNREFPRAATIRSNANRSDNPVRPI